MNRDRCRVAPVRLTLCFAAAIAVMFAGGLGAQAQQAERLTLKQALSKALQSSPELALAQLRVQVSQREVGLRRSQFLPNVYAGSGIAYTNGFPLAAGGGAPALFSLAFQEALLDPAARAEIRVAEQAAEQQRLETDKVRDAIIVRVASSYLELAKIRRELDLLRREDQSAQKILDFTRQRMEAGFELPIDVTRARLTSARIAQRITHLEGQDDVLSDQLRTQLGLAIDQRVDVVAEDLPAATGAAVDELLSQALASSVDLKQADAERMSKVARLQGERRSYLPTVSLVGQYNLLAHFNNYDQFFNKFQRNNLVLGLDVRIPIFSARRSAAVSLAQADLRAAEMALANKRVEVSADVRQKARQTRELQLGGEMTRLELELSQQNLQVVQSQFQEGRASLRDMEAAQLDENDKWLAFLDADFARQRAQLDLLQSTGQVAQLVQ